MARKRNTDKGVTIMTARGTEATRTDDDDNLPDHKRYPHDPTVPWSDAWVADRMARTDAVLRRVQNNDSCCGGLRCMHYVNVPIQRVRGKGAPRSQGNAIGYDDGLLRLLGRLGG